MTTTIIDTCDGLVVAVAPALTSDARAIVRTNRAERGRVCDPALAVIKDVNLACSRFDPDSELRRVNADPAGWHSVGTTCRTAIREAWWAHRRTSGQFDPRLRTPDVAGDALRQLPWRPRIGEHSSRVTIGGVPVDLDGVARGLALRWASRLLSGTHHLLEVGDACRCSGRGPDGQPWRIGLHDPLGDPSPLAVLELTDTSCTTSTATRARVAGQRLAGGLLAVTVVGPDAVAAEVWSAALLAAGERDVAEVADRRRLPAAWVTEDGKLHVATALESRVLWRR